MSDYKNFPAGHYKHPYNIIDDNYVEIKTVVVHEFRMGDVDDPDLYAAEPLWQWQNSEVGAWVMKHAVETPEWHRQIDSNSFGWQYRIVAKLKAKDYTYWSIKWKKLTA